MQEQNKEEFTSNTSLANSDNYIPSSLSSLGFLSKETPFGSFIQYPQKEFQKMLEKQTLNRWYNKNLSSKSERLEVVLSYMQKICLILELQNSTFCLSVKIFDAVISKFPIDSKQMKILGVVSVMMASKMNERYDKVISLKDINTYLLPVEIPHLASMERKIFKVLNFQLNLIIPDNFIKFIIHLFFANESNFLETQSQNEEKINQFIQIVKYLQLITIVDYSFYKYTSIAVAVSVIMMTRCMMKFEEIWPSELEHFTGIKTEHVKECLDLLAIRFKEKFLMKVFNKLDNEISSDSFILKNTDKLSISQTCEKYFLDDKCIEKFIQSLNTISSFRKTSKKN